MVQHGLLQKNLIVYLSLGKLSVFTIVITLITFCHSFLPYILPPFLPPFFFLYQIFVNLRTVLALGYTMVNPNICSICPLRNYMLLGEIDIQIISNSKIASVTFTQMRGI